MRRRGLLFLGLIGFVVVLIVTYSLAYRAGINSGTAQVTQARIAFQTRIAGAPTAPAGGGAIGSGQPGGNATRPAGQGSAPAGGPRGGGNTTPGAGSAPAGTPRPTP